MSLSLITDNRQLRYRADADPLGKQLVDKVVDVVTRGNAIGSPQASVRVCVHEGREAVRVVLRGAKLDGP